MKKLSIYIGIFLFAVNIIAAQEKPTAFINARIIPVVGEPIEQGIVVIQNGRITAAIGDARTVRLSSDIVTIDVGGKTIMPGLVDSHSHIGEPAGVFSVWSCRLKD